MRGLIPWVKWAFLGIALGVIPTVFLEGVRLLVEEPLSWTGLAIRWAFVSSILLLAGLARPYSIGRAQYMWPVLPGIGIGGVVAGVLYARDGWMWAAWLLLGTIYVLVLGLDSILAGSRNPLRRWIWRTALALTGGVIPVALSQWESRFADEEFFVALEALSLAVLWLLLWGMHSLHIRSSGLYLRRGIRTDRRYVGLAFCLAAFAVLGGTVWAYRHSFYPPQAPVYPGISGQSPFLCGSGTSDPQVYNGEEVFRRILDRVAANPRKGPPEYGMLALGTGEPHWAEAFRDALLQEAAEGRYTGPAHSVKSVQLEAALRVYYFWRVRDRFPDLFSEADVSRLRDWFAAINHRALTVEWVDLMYALAFSKWPEGPYENQENGAGLLALLETTDLADPDLSAANRAYLARNRRGWTARFRATDDAVVYQPVWIYNAYFQSLYTGETIGDNARRSFEWSLLQALPDGAPLRYNHPGSASLAGVAYFGATLFRDPRFIWLAGQAVTELERQGKYLSAQPGVEQPVLLEGRSPSEGSCLIYGDSGLPNQTGPLAPDKIVFRDGWGEWSKYLLVNLRFTGWHRYKATNTVSLFYWDGPLAAEKLDGEPFRWLPVGRSLFRDKRVPRENLNGLVVEKTGMAAVLYTLTGIGGRWAQDPPYYAEVLAFETGTEKDWAHIRLTGWRGWRHDRWIHFYHNGGPVIIVDEARGPAGSGAALVWHLIGAGPATSERIKLQNGNNPVEFLLLPLDSDGRVAAGGEPGKSNTRVIYHALPRGHFRTATLFLPGDWAGAEVKVGPDGQSLWVAQREKSIILRLGTE